MLVFLVLWIASAVKPGIPEDWFLENLLVFGLIALLAISYRWLALSDCSYLLILIFLCLHECGAHYQYDAAIPGEWMKLIVNTQRNHYDRLDTSSAAICAAGLLRLCRLEPDSLKGHFYWSSAVRILTALCEKYLPKADPKWEGILRGGVYHVHKGLGVDESVMWGE